MTSATFGPLRALVDDREAGVERFANARARSTPPASGDTTTDPGATARASRTSEDGAAIEVVHRDVEEALDLPAWSSIVTTAIHAGRRRAVGDELRADRRARCDLAVLRA
jgi:hypothetical protein